MSGILDQIVVGKAELTFLPPGEAVNRINLIASKLLKQIGHEQQSPNFLAATVYYLALKAQVQVLNYLNDDNLFCQVLWDPRTELPSHPSLAADISKYGEIFNPPSRLRAFLDSFSGWMTLHREQLEGCCCRVNTGETVTLDIVVNTILAVEGNSLRIKLLVGIRTDNTDHLEKHYGKDDKKEDIVKQSQVDDSLYIIYVCENRLIVKDGEISVEAISSISPQPFDVGEFSKLIRGFVSTAEL